MRVTYGHFFGAPSFRVRVEKLQAAMNSVPQIDCPIKHYFSPGMYAREITIPAGTVLVGAVHKTQNMAVLSKGRLLVATKTGPIEIAAPHLLTVRPGDKNTATALEDSVWTNFFPTSETNIEKLVEELTESKACELLGGANNMQLMANKAKELEA